MASGVGEVLRKLVTVWSFETEDAAIGELDKKLANLQGTVQVVAATLAAAAAEIYGFASVTATAALTANKMAQQVGMTAENFQLMGAAFRASGLELEDAGMSFRFLARHVYDASKGSKEATKIFQDLGVSIRENGGTNGPLAGTDVIFKRIADRFAAMGDSPADGLRKVALAQELLGRSGGELIPILNKGGDAIAHYGDDAKALGLVLGKDTIDAAKKYKAAMRESQQVVLAISYAVGKEMLPVVTEVLTMFKEYGSANKQFITDKVVALSRAFANYIRIVWQFLKPIGVSLKGIVDLVGGFERLVTVLGYALGIFAGTSLLYGIGAIAQQLGFMLRVLWAVRLAALQTALAFIVDWAAAALPVLVIGAAVLALGLLIEDFIVFMKGGKSAIGDFFESIGIDGQAAKQFFMDLGNIVETYVFDKMRKTLDVLNSIWLVFKAMNNLRSGELGAAWDNVKDIGSLGAKYLPALPGGTVSGLWGVNPADSAGGAGGGSRVDVGGVTVNLGPGVDMNQAIGAVRIGVAKGIDDAQMRAAGRAFQGPASAGGH